MAVSKKKCPNVGRMEHKIDIIRKTTARKDGGGITETWTKNVSVWSSIKPKKINELLAAQNLEQQVSHTIVIRYKSDLTTDDLIRFGTRFMRIKSIINIDERNRYHQISALENKNAEVTVS